jgi:outer membrane protein assembly factor BamB
LDKSVVNQPTAVADDSRYSGPIRHLVSLPGGLLAISSGKGSDQVGIYDPKNAPKKVGRLSVPEGHKLACPPVALDGGVLLADRAGQVSLLDPQTGDPLAVPFQPPLEPGAEVDWAPLAVVEGKPQVLLADGKSKLYWLGLQEEPRPHFEILAEAAVATPIVSPLAVLGETVYAGDAGKMLAPFSLPKLVRGKERLLDGLCALGPVRVGDGVLVATDDGYLCCLDAHGRMLWQKPLPYGPLAGLPLRLGSQYLLASRTGTLWRVDAATGKEIAKLETGYPLATGPVSLGRQLLVGGHDGTLYEVRQP